MSWKTFYSLKKLVKEGERLAAECQTVSFDLFDTLLVRRIHDPDIVKLPVARYISSLASEAGLACSPEAVQACRDRLEKEQRQETAQLFEDHEACYPVFMERTLREIFGERYGDSLLADITAYELEMESRVLVPRSLLAGWMSDLHKQGKRILIISDIYLPSQHLKTLVDRAGLLEFAEAVVSSADTFLAKASGK
ncbi:MAG: hypothetical protein IH612_01495, partial [Desulfofustis sp.]|nr:hypothetical protein [Desulfofustis sp.]